MAIDPNVVPTNIVITDVTNGSLDANYDWVGSGVFDVLMNAVNKNIESQYTKGRITGSDYATVYLGAIQSVLAQSVEYVMKEKVSEAQVDNMVADTGFKDREVTVTELNSEKQRAIMDEELRLKYVERVIKDKAAADMGLDNVYKQVEEAKVSNPDYVYSPKYKDV